MLQQQFELVMKNLADLGARRLIGLGLALLLITGAVVTGGYYLNRPEFEPLYAGLSPLEASRMGAVLRENGVTFDLSADGTILLVQRGHGAGARMMLAEKGLPGNSSGGYELFDKMGSLGLTSFMQEVTRVRVLEGELARSIQTLKGVRAARVHIVMPEGTSLRKNRQPPSASVIIRTEQAGDPASTDAIRHLVSAAIPGMTHEQVRVLSTEGLVLAGGGDGASLSQGRQSILEKSLNKDLQENIRQTLAPYLGIGNFQISVSARLNTDKRQINEVTYDPNTRVERSVRTVKETGSQTAAAPGTVSVEQNIPGEQKGNSKGDQNRKANDRREELTNFELSSKSTSVVSEGYRIEGVTVAVVINRKQLLATLGGAAAKDAVDARIAEIEKIVATAAGVDEKRGDRVTIAAVDFLPGSEALEPAPSPGIVELLAQQSGSYLKSIAIVVAALLIVWLGLRPIGQQLLLASPSGGAASLNGDVLPPIEMNTMGAIPSLANSDFSGGGMMGAGSGMPELNMLDQLVMGKEEQAAIVLKQLLKGGRV